ncbi:Cna B-type domain-containing protein, partial [Peptoniphilus sp. oral taxon 386]|uniref:Cna B-type domain-containing protein n=1 Tax=Peptoniphilus sp. oral taxon 386 TaxID=652713 RepID=UPI0001DAA4CA
RTPGKVDVEGEKTWNDNNDQDGKRPTEIKINLMKKVGDGPVVKKETKTVTAADGWKWSWKGLPEYEGGKKITYSITEEAVADYTTQINGYNVTNSRTPGKVDVEGEKTWNDNNDQDGKRPTEIKINLMKKVGDGPVVKKETKTVTAADGWKWSWKGLPEYEGGKKITYSITEEAVADYTTQINGYN